MNFELYDDCFEWRSEDEYLRRVEEHFNRCENEIVRQQAIYYHLTNTYDQNCLSAHKKIVEKYSKYTFKYFTARFPEYIENGKDGFVELLLEYYTDKEKILDAMESFPHLKSKYFKYYTMILSQLNKG